MHHVAQPALASPALAGDRAYVAADSLAVAASLAFKLAGLSQRLKPAVMRFTGFGRFATRGQVDFTARLACKGSPGVQAKGNLAMFRWKATEVLKAIDVPVLVLTGTKDIVTLPSASDFIAHTAPRAQLLHVEGAGHMGFMERSKVYNEAIARFAGEIFAGFSLLEAGLSQKPAAA